jgi:hypothetical protein
LYEKQREIEQQEDLMLNFSTYDDMSILDVDIDNAFLLMIWLI